MIDTETRGNDGEVPIRRNYATHEHPALRQWAQARLAQPDGWRPRFMVYSGLGGPDMTAERLSILQALGAESFLVAADLPSQLGFDPDHELAYAQVGRAGVSCTTLADFEQVCSRLDLTRADSVGLLANSIGHVGLAMAACVLEDRQATDVRLVMQNDPLKEFTARGTEIFTPEQAVRIACDCVAYAIEQKLPGSAITVCSNHLDVAGAGPVVALAVCFANALVYVDELVARGYSADSVLGKMMFFLNERSDLYVTTALFRCARVIWADLVADRYGVPVEDQPVMTLMGYAHGLESADEPLTNVPRITLSVLGAMQGGVDYLCASAYDEALRIPSVDAAALALRTMQVVAHEHGVLNSIDPLQGSAKLHAIESYLRTAVSAELARIDEIGGGLAALHHGYVRDRIDEHRGTRERQLADGERQMVGHTIYRDSFGTELFRGRSSGELDFDEVERAARDRVRAHRLSRDDEAALREALRVVSDAAASTANLMPPTVAALRAGATAQETIDATREGFCR